MYILLHILTYYMKAKEAWYIHYFKKSTKKKQEAE